MVQSLKLGGAANAEAESGIRRINRLPIVVVSVLVIAFLGVIFYGLTSRGLHFGRDSGPETSSGNPASTFADQIKRGVTDGIIGEPRQQITFQPTPAETKQAEEKANNPFTPQPGERQEQQRGQELENEAVWRARLEREQREQYMRERHRQRMARLQANDAAYDAPLAIDRSKLEARADETTQPERRQTLHHRQPPAPTPIFMPPHCALVSAGRISIRTDSPPRRTSSTPILRISATSPIASCRSSHPLN